MLSRLQLGDFRNYRQLDIALSPSLNVILGDNGSGKTSLLEAIYFIGSGGRSFRGGRLSRLVRDGAPAATLYAEVVCEEKHHRLGVRRTPGGIDAIKLNGTMIYIGPQTKSRSKVSATFKPCSSRNSSSAWEV